MSQKSCLEKAVIRDRLYYSLKIVNLSVQARIKRVYTFYFVQLQYGTAEPRLKELNTRHVKEIVEFITIKGPKNDEIQGRQSGSSEWRKARGEIGDVSTLAKQMSLF